MLQVGSQRTKTHAKPGHLSHAHGKHNSTKHASSVHATASDQAAAATNSTHKSETKIMAPANADHSQEPPGGDVVDEPDKSPGWLFNLGLFAGFVIIILFTMIVILLLIQCVANRIERWQSSYLAKHDAIAVNTSAFQKAVAADLRVAKRPQLKRSRTTEEVAGELNGMELWHRLNGDHVRLALLLDIANSSRPRERVQDIVEKASKVYKMNLKDKSLDQATQGLLALAMSVKAAQGQHSGGATAKQRWAKLRRKIMLYVKVSRAFSGGRISDRHEENTQTHDQNHAEHLADRYQDGEHKQAHKAFKDARLGKSAVASYFASQRWLDHTTIAFVFIYSQICALVYAMYLKTRFPLMYAFMGPWLLVSRGEAMAIIVLTCLMVMLLTRSLMTAVRPYMAWSSVFQTIADKHVLIHKYIGVMLVLCSAAHVLGHIRGSIPAIIGETDSSEINKAFTYGTKIRFNFNSWAGALQSWPAVTGVLLLLILLCFWALSNERVRRRWFELFHYPHLILIVLWCACLIAHGWKQWLGIGVPLASVSVLPVVLLYGFTRIADIRRGTHDSIVIHNAIVKKTNVLLEINTGSTGFIYETGMYCMLKVPAVSEFEWHPFTIASGGGKTKFQVLFAVVGDWTTGLKNLLVEAQTRNPRCPPYPQICVRGGYGAPAEGMKDKEHIIMVGGGVGATPFLSFLSNITTTAQTGDFDQFAGVRSATFFWLSRDPNDFVWVNEYNNVIRDTPSLRNRVSLRLCLTKALDTKQDGNAELALLWQGVEIAISEFDSKELAAELGVPTQFGRPKWPEEFGGVYQDLTRKFGESMDMDIAVFACGNKMLTESLEEACTACTDSRVMFRLYAEEF